MRLLNINAAGKYLTTEPYTGSCLASESGVFDVPYSHTKAKQVLVAGMLDALKSLLSSEANVKTHVDSKMGFVIG
jgi:FAST kinase-like protein, subdomain 2